MSLATHSQLLPLLPDAIVQVSRESEQNHLVSCVKCLPLAFVENQNQDSGGLFGNPQNLLITGGTFVVSFLLTVYKQLMIVHILFARTIFYLPIPEKSIRRSQYFKNQTPVHCLLDGKMYLTSFRTFSFSVLIVN